MKGWEVKVINTHNALILIGSVNANTYAEAVAKAQQQFRDEIKKGSTVVVKDR